MISETLDLLCDLLNQTADHGYQVERAHSMCRLRASFGTVKGWTDSEQGLLDWMGPYYQGLKNATTRPASNAHREALETACLLAMAQDRKDMERFS